MSRGRVDAEGLVRAGQPSVPVPSRPPDVRPWTGVRRRLAVRLDGAGDVLMTTPALRALRARRPDEHLALLVSPAGAPAAMLLPEVDDVIVYEPPWMPGARSGGPGPETDLAMAERLRAGGYDGAVIFTVHSQSSLPASMLCHLAGIPRRLAHSHANPYGLLTDWVPEPEPVTPFRHEARRQLDLVGAVGFEADETHLSLRVPPGSVRRIKTMLTRSGVTPGEFVLVHPGAAAPSRRWPAERFADVARAISAETGMRIVIAGGPGDEPLTRAVAAAAGPGALDVTGRLTFAEFAALVAQAPLLVANNSAPAHVAAAVGTPVVVVYAMTNVQHGPWQVPSRVVSAEVPCAGCRRSVCPLVHHQCLRSIGPAAVVAAGLDLLAETWPPARTTSRGAAAGSRRRRRGGGGRRGRSRAVGARRMSSAVRAGEGPRPAGAMPGVGPVPAGAMTADASPAVAATRAPVEASSTADAARGDGVERIAVLRALALGDLLCAVPTLRALRAAHPDAHITLIGLPWAAEFVERFGDLLDALSPFPGWPGMPEVAFDAARTAAFLGDAQHRFDLAVQLQGSGLASNAFAAMLGARQTAGFLPPGLSAPPAPGQWLHHDPRGHEIHRLLRLAPAFGSGHRPAPPDDHLEFPVRPAERIQAEGLLAAASIDRGAYAVVHPGSSDPRRRWPAERFGEVVRELRTAGLRVLVTGVAPEAAVTARVAAAAPDAALDLAGRTSLGVLAALVERAVLVVSNDTGVSHLAAALRTPSVVVFTGSDPARWAPLDTDRHTAVGDGLADPGTHGGCRDAGVPCLGDACSFAARAGAAGAPARAPETELVITAVRARLAAAQAAAR